MAFVSLRSDYNRHVCAPYLGVILLNENEITLKHFLTIYLLVASFNATACFVQPEGVIESHNRQFDLLIISSIAVAFITLILRFIHQKSRLWVPTIAILAFGYIPFILFNLESYGLIGPGGACGRPGMLLIGKICLGGYLLILTYELFKYLKSRRKS